MGVKQVYTFEFIKNYQIENIFIEELAKRNLLFDFIKKDYSVNDFFQEGTFNRMVKKIEHIHHYNWTINSIPRKDLFLQLNIKNHTQKYVVFDLTFKGYKYIRRDIKMPMDLYEEFAEKGRPIIKFMKDYKVFIAHASENKNSARKIAKNLTKNGYQAWFDEWEIKVGDSIVDKINDGIQDSSFMVVLFSKDSINKPWVKKEMNSGLIVELNKRNVFVLPALIEDCDIPPLFSDKRYADFTKSFDHGFDELVKSL
ncbi:MAG: toll/interleukin-1 receptor domain-containing protein [Marinifilaceae bacterium]